MTDLTMSSATRVICSNTQCTQSGLVHNKCFEKFESLLVVFIGKYGRCRDWSEKQVMMSTSLLVKEIS